MPTTPPITPSPFPAQLVDHIEMWSIARLLPYASNPRIHSERQIRQIADSIREFGLNRPVLVDAAGTIIAGHAITLAARHLGLEQVPVIVLSHLNEAQKRAFRIADNRLAESAEWNTELLQSEIRALEAALVDTGLLGFDPEELKQLNRDLERQLAQVDEDAVPATPIQSVSVPGDLWILGNHRVLCGNATSSDALKELLDDGQADLVFTDPPYNVNYTQKTGRGGLRRIANDNLGQEFEPFLEKVCSNILAVCRGAIYICMSSSELDTLQRTFEGAGGHFSTFIIWAKNRFTLGRSDYQRQYEPILYGWKEGGPHFWCGARNQGDVWSIDRPFANKLHPTAKPVELSARAIENSSQPGDVVLDLFGGSGSTLIACEKLGRAGRMLEIDPQYADVMVERWQQYTGGEAVLSGTNRAFAAIRDERCRKAA